MHVGGNAQSNPQTLATSRTRTPCPSEKALKRGELTGTPRVHFHIHPLKFVVDACWGTESGPRT